MVIVQNNRFVSVCAHTGEREREGEEEEEEEEEEECNDALHSSVPA